MTLPINGLQVPEQMTGHEETRKENLEARKKALGGLVYHCTEYTCTCSQVSALEPWKSLRTYRPEQFQWNGTPASSRASEERSLQDPSLVGGSCQC